jgi:hypothetical protein
VASLEDEIKGDLALNETLVTCAMQEDACYGKVLPGGHS